MRVGCAEPFLQRATFTIENTTASYRIIMVYFADGGCPFCRLQSTRMPASEYKVVHINHLVIYLEKRR